MYTKEGKKEENKTFELSILNPKNLANLQEWEAKQLKLVEDNQFIEIKDPKSFKEAKSRRTNLKTGRTELQNQDKIIATTTKAFRQGTKTETDRLIAISTPSEDKQQDEIDRYQKVLDEEKNRQAREEEERKEGLTKKINDTETTLSNIINGIEHGSISDDQQFFDEIVQGVTNEVDFQEFQFLFDDMIETNKTLLKTTIENIVLAEETRLVDEKVQGFAERLELDDYIYDPSVGVYVKRGFEISMERLRTFNSGEVDQRMSEVNDKIVILDRQDHDKIVQGQKSRVIEVREGLLDMVHQMTLGDSVVQTNIIKTAIDLNANNNQESFNHAIGEFEIMVEMVDKALKRKLEILANDQKIEEQKIEIDLELFFNECERRYNVVIGLGLKSTEVDDLRTFDGFGMSYTSMQIDCIKLHEFEDFITEKKQLIKEIQEKEIQEKAEEKRMEIVMTERTKTIEDLGMVKGVDDVSWEGFGMTIMIDDVYQAESMDSFVDDVKDAVKVIEDAETKKLEDEIEKNTRILIIEQLGMVESEEGVFKGFGTHIFDNEIMKFKSIELLVENIERNKKEDQDEKDRQERLSGDKRKIIDFFESNFDLSENSLPLKEEETIKFMDEFKEKFHLHIEKVMFDLNKL